MGIISYDDYIKENKLQVYKDKVLSDELTRRRKGLDRIYNNNFNQQVGKYATTGKINIANNNSKNLMKENAKFTQPKNLYGQTKQEQQKSQNLYNEKLTQFKNSDWNKDFQVQRNTLRNSELIQDYYNRQNEISNEKSSFLDKGLINNTLRGAKSLFTPFFNSDQYITREDGSRYYLPTNSDLKMEKAKQDSSGFWKFLIDTSYNVGKIAGSTALNTVSGGSAGSLLYFGNMYTSSLNQAISDGYSKDKAALYAAASTGTEYLTGKLLGTATKGLTNGTVLELNDAITNKLMSKFGANQAIAKFLGNAGSEATEEFIQEYIDNFNKLLFLENSTDIKDYWNVVRDPDVLVSALYSAGIGALSGGLLGNINSEQNVYDTYKKELIDLKNNTTDINTINRIETILKNIDNIKYSTVRNENVENDINNIIKGIGSTQTDITDTITNNISTISNENDKLNTQIDTKNQTNDNNDVNNVSTKLPTVLDIVNQEKSSKNSNINLPLSKKNYNTNIELSLKQQQNEIIQNSNPVNDAYHTWIRTEKDIKTFKEALNDADYKEYFEAGENFDDSYTAEMAKKALETGKITVYSSNPIEQGTFISPSKMEAQSYSGTGKIYSKEVKLTDVAWIDPTQGQYAKINSNILPVLDATSINNANKALIPVDNSQINQVKGNIPIDQDLLNKYNNVSEMINKNINKYDGKVDVKSSILELNNIDLNSMSQKELSDLAINIFEKYNSSNTFINDGNKIMVTRGGIKESINKILYNKNQKQYLKEHLQVFSDLGDIIESATLASQTTEGKLRENNKIWNYYLNGLNINNNNYLFEFDVVSRQNGENHYRVQRLEKINNKKANASVGNTITSVTPTLETFAFSNDNISRSTQNVKSDILPTINNMQNTEKNVNKILNPLEISKLTKEDASTTPLLPKKGNINKINDGESHFATNIENKVNMITDEQKKMILSKKDVLFYDKVTNKESLDKAFNRLNENGSSETSRWFNTKVKDMDATDVAEGWILLKQYADNGDYGSMVEAAKKMREIGTTAGQTVQAFNIMERMTPEGMVKYAQSELSEAYDRMVKNKTKEWINKNREKFDLKPDEVKFIMDTMKEVQNMEDGYDKRVKLAQIQKLMTDKLPPEKGAKIKSWMRISMLFNPKTQVRNVAGNALIMPINSFGDLFSSYADKLISRKTGVRTTGTTNIKAMLKGLKRGAYEATNDYKQGINTKNMDGNRFEISDGKSFSEKNLIGRTLNRTESLLNYVMDVGDRVFSEAAFENSLQNQMILNNTTEITQEMIDIAHQEALSRTWNDNNNYTKFVLDVRRGLNKINVNGYGLGDVLIPFAKTPANLTKAIVDYSPAGLVSTIKKGINLKRSFTNGQYTATMQHDFVQSLGKATAGTMLYILGIALANAGITSGKSDDDKDTANFLKNTLGVSSYSIKIGGKSFTYDWAQPLAAPLSITANVVNSKNNESQALLEAIIGSLDTAGSILLEQSFLQSINDVLSDNDNVASGIINEVLELPARAIPTFSKQIADLIDGTQRTSFEYGKPIQSAFNNVKAKIPFVSKTLSPSVDTLGREIKKYGGKNNIFNVFLNPANVNTENISESAKEIYRLYKKTGDTNIMPRVAPYYINKNGNKIIMTSKEKAEYQKISGKIVEDNIKELLENSDYKKLNDTEKAEIINKIVNYSYNKARKDVLEIEMSDEYNKINSYIDDGGGAANYYLNKKEIDYSYTNPSKYKAIVQVSSYSNYLSYKKQIDEIKENYTNSSQRKNAVIQYVNSLRLTVPQKAMLIKMNYSSYSNYDNQIINYINQQKISFTDKKEILEELGFKVRNGRVYTK